jgi:hypothetical protein
MSQRRDGVFPVQQRLGRGLELRQFLDDGLPLPGVPPDADALIGRWLPGLLIDDDGIPPDFPFES